MREIKSILLVLSFLALSIKVAAVRVVLIYIYNGCGRVLCVFVCVYDFKSDYEQKTMSSLSDHSKLDALLHKTRWGGGGFGQNLKKGELVDNTGGSS